MHSYYISTSLQHVQLIFNYCMGTEGVKCHRAVHILTLILKIDVLQKHYTNLTSKSI